MDEIINQYLLLVITLLAILVGLAALVGGLRKRENPFFWLKNNNSLYLKKPAHYILFGIVTTALGVFFLIKRLVAMRFF